MVNWLLPLQVCLAWLLSDVSAQSNSASLTSTPETFSGTLCPLTDAHFICSIKSLTNLKWFFDSSQAATYSFSRNDRYPIEMEVEPEISPSQFTFYIWNATLLNIDEEFDGVSIMNTSVQFLHDMGISEIECGTQTIHDSVPLNFNLQGPPPLVSIGCSLSFLMENDLNISLNWSPSFNTQHKVERYNVTVTPDPSSCSSDQVSPSEDYSCSGLDLQTNYTITVSAINCGDQEGGNVFINVNAHLLVPTSVMNFSIETASDSTTLFWSEPTATTGTCSFSESTNYTVFLEDNYGMVVEERTVSSGNSCSNGSCSTMFSTPICRASIVARNQFGVSDMSSEKIISVKITSTNISLIVVGVILWILALIGCFVLILKVITNKHLQYLSVCTLCFSVFLLVVSLCMWVAAGAYVEQQENMCITHWQLTRDRLILSAHVMSDVTAILVLAMDLVLMILCFKYQEKKSVSCDIKPLEIHAIPEKIELDDHEYATTQHSTAQPAVQHSIAEPAQDQNYNKLDSKPATIYHPLDHRAATQQERWEPIRSPLQDVYCEKGESSKDAADRINEEKYLAHIEYPCHSMKIYIQQNALHTSPQQVAAWMMRYRKWPQEDLSEGKPLKVYFMNYCPGEWKYQGRSIDAGFIMEILQSSWRGCFITSTSKNEASIRVKFRECNWSALGSLAKAIPPSEPTMVLDFTAFDHDTIKATVIHQFGHALGLGHVLMDPGDWAILKKYVNVEKMMKSLGVHSEEDLEVQWTGKGLSEVNRDSLSVMQYCTCSSWISQDHVLSDVPSKDKKVLQILRKHAKIYQQKLSNNDKETLDMLIGRSNRQSQNKTEELTLNDLTYLKSNDGSEIFNLTEVLSSHWESIGMELGVSPKMLEKLKVKNETDYKRMVIIWKMWLDYEIDKYPPTDVGLIDLLKTKKLFKKNFGFNVAMGYTRFKVNS